MVRLFHAYFPVRTLLLAASDTFAVVLGLLLAASSGAFLGESRGFSAGNLSGLGVTCLVCSLCLYYFDLYESHVFSDFREATGRLIQVLGTACIVLGLLEFVDPQFESGVATLQLGLVLSGIILLGCRKLLLTLNEYPHLSDRVVFLSGGPLAVALAEEMNSHPELGLRVLGYVGGPVQSSAEDEGFHYLGDIEELSDVIASKRVDRLIVTMSERQGYLPLETLLRFKSHGLKVEDGAEIYETVTGKLPIQSLELSRLVFSPGFRISRAMLTYKRIFSFVVSVVCLLFALPVMALVALAIRLDSPGPALFRQKRVGKDGRFFTLYKFRSLRLNADSDGVPRPVQEHDDRLTRVGGLLRRCRLDELPQLFNILLGDLDFVGPRPFVPVQEEEMVRQIPYYRYRWMVKPGATGWAQIHRGYCATVDDNVEKLAYDLYYIKNMSAGLDLLILFQTMKTILLRRGGR